MKFWKPPHEHEELLEEQIESIIQEVQRNGYGFWGTITAQIKSSVNNNHMLYIQCKFLYMNYEKQHDCWQKIIDDAILLLDNNVKERGVSQKDDVEL